MHAPAADRLRPLTGIRFVAALQVLFFHFGGKVFRSTVPLVESVRRAGYVAVSFFFILSGFVLTYHYAEPLRTGRVSGRTFFWRRVCRIYPVYLLSTLICIPLAIHKPWGDLSAAFGDASLRAKLGTIAAHLLMVQAWFPRLVVSWNIPGWSLSAELFFYALFPLVAQRMARLSNRRHLMTAALLLWGVSLGLASSYVLFDPDGVGRASADVTGFWMCLLKFCPLSRLPEFLLGAVLGQLFLTRAPRAASTSRRAGGWLSTVAALALLVALALSGKISYPLLHQGLLIPLFGMLIYGLALGGGPISAVVGTRPFRLCGEASFALCVLQVPLMFWLLVVSGHSFAQQPRIAFFALYFVLALGLSFICHYFVERPLRAWLDRLLQQRRGRSPPGRLVNEAL
jgi:peptidoglycan/LPS O-acetylase OafA/YrhL